MPIDMNFLACKIGKCLLKPHLRRIKKRALFQNIDGQKFFVDTPFVDEVGLPTSPQTKHKRLSMARPSKLTQDQCERIRMLKNEGASAPQLAKRFRISESSLYKILNNSYTAAPAGSLPSLVEREDLGPTLSIFTKSQSSASKVTSQLDQQIASRVRQAAEAGGRIDEITLAAAELIVARARYQRSLDR
jgi:hypothetical protein